MLLLILKDFRANWLFQLLSLFVTVVLCLITLAAMQDDGGQIIIVLYGAIIVGMCSLISLVFMRADEYFKVDELYASLPVTRSQIVKARYSTSFVQILLVLTCCFLSTKSELVHQGGLEDPALRIIYHPIFWFVLLVLVLMLISISYPFYFKYGLERGVVVLALIHLGVLILGFVVNKMIGTTEILSGFFEQSYQLLFQQSWMIFLASFLFFVAMILIASVKLSCKFYQNRDL